MRRNNQNENFDKEAYIIHTLKFNRDHNFGCASVYKRGLPHKTLIRYLPLPETLVG